MKKRFIYIFLLAVILTFSSCSYNPNTEETVPENYVGNPQGYEYTVLSSLSSLSSICNITDDGVYSEKLKAHYKKIEDDLGCKINLEITSNPIESNVFKSAAGKNKSADLIETDALTVKTLSEGGFVTAVEDMGFSSDDEKFGLESQKNFLKKDGKTYGIFPIYLGISAPTYSYALLYNDKIVSKSASLSPAVLTEQKNWTKEAFYRISKEVTDTQSENKTYAFITPTASFPDMINAALLSEGQIPFFSDNEKIKCGYEKYKTMNTVDFIRKMVTVDRLSLDVTEENGDISAFSDKKTAFLVTTAKTFFSLSEDFPMQSLGKDLRLVSFPSEKNSTAFGKNDTFYAITTASKKDRIDSKEILDRIFSPFEGENEDSWKEKIKAAYFFEKSDFSNYISSLTNAIDDGLLNFRNYTDAFSEAWSLCINGQKSTAQAYEEIEGVIKGLIDTEEIK